MTRGEIKTAIQQLGYSADTATAQEAAINDLNRRLHGRKRWPWQEAIGTAGTIAVSGSTVSALPSDLLMIDAVRISAGTNNIELEWKSQQEVRRLLHLDRTNGYPQYWTYYDSAVYVYPRANAAYTVTLDYILKATDLSSDSDVPVLPSTYHDLYVWYGASRLAARERDWTAYGAYNQQYVERLSELEQELGIEQKQSARHVEPASWYRDF